MNSEWYVPVGSPEIVALDMQQHQQPVAERCQHLGQLGFVQLEFVLEPELLAMRPESVHPFCKSKFQ